MIIGGLFYAIIIYPFIWIGNKVVDYSKKENERILNDIRHNELQNTYTENEKQLRTYVDCKNVLIIKNGTKCVIELTSPNGDLISMPLDGRDAFLKKFFRVEWEYACWVEQVLAQLTDNEIKDWNTLSTLGWKAVRVLEKRNKFTSDAVNFVTVQNFEWLQKMIVRSLTALHYKSVNTNNKKLISSIISDIQGVSKQELTVTDEVHKQSLLVIIETHNKRLDTQAKISSIITLLDIDIQRLIATLNLIIEGVTAEISACGLGKTQITTRWDGLVLNINLSSLDNIYEEHKIGL